MAPSPYVALNPDDAAGSGLAEGAEIELVVGGVPRKLAVRLVATMPRGVAGVPAGLPSLAGAVLPEWIEIRQ